MGEDAFQAALGAAKSLVSGQLLKGIGNWIPQDLEEILG